MFKWFLLSASLICALSARADSLVELHDGNLRLGVSAETGARVMSFSLEGYDNVLAVGEPFKKGFKAEISPQAPHTAYLGHVSWLAPQSQWWQFQSLNQERKLAQASWPPDAYLAFAPARTVKASPTLVNMQGEASPISGVRMDKTFALENGRARISTSLLNISDRELPWTPWFITRVPGDAHIYVPADEHSVFNYSGFDTKFFEPIYYEINQNLFQLRKPQPKAGGFGQQGKFHLHPRSNWMASFHAGQLLIIRFEMLERDAVYPEHGLVEVYFRNFHEGPDASVIELESHSAAAPLPVGATISATQHWSLYPYSGSDDIQAHRAFLQKVLGEAF